MANEIDDREFEIALQDKRHKEIKTALQAILTALNKPDDDSAVTDAIGRQTRAIEGFVSAIKALPAPQVTVQPDNSDVGLSLGSMSQNIIAELQQLRAALQEEDAEEIMPKQWVFTVRRNSDGLIQNITATQTK